MSGKRKDRGRKGYAIPENFAANAGRRNAELTALYGVSEWSVCKWRRETGLRALKSHGERRARFGACDSDEEIRACLTCPALSCSNGDCARRKNAGTDKCGEET
ncbi:MAG: hypothetical protein IJR54_00795 [Oscillibacter sp.]|nr:hypothetical protein [Oscillibacter sp.]